MTFVVSSPFGFLLVKILQALCHLFKYVKTGLHEYTYMNKFNMVPSNITDLNIIPSLYVY